MLRLVTRISATLLACLTVSGSVQAAKRPIRVVATVQNLGAIAREVGGERVEVATIASGIQDAHFVDPKPSFIVLLRSADLLLVNGLDLEVGWVPPLTQGARNGRILYGGDGHLDCSTWIEVLEVPTVPVSRAQGDVHPYGNPHYLTDPLNATLVARGIAEAFKRESPDDSEYFEERSQAFAVRLHAVLFGEDLVDYVGGNKLERLARAGQLDSFLASSVVEGKPLEGLLGGWLGRMRPFAGARIVTYHRDYSYFARRFGLEPVDYVEPKPGIPPSAKHITELTERLQRGDIKLLITRPFVEKRSTELLFERTGIPVLTLPLEVGGAPGTDDYFELFNHVISEIASAMGARAR